MSAVNHLIAALVELERESRRISDRQAPIRAAIEAFGIDADEALLTAMREQESQRPYRVEIVEHDDGTWRGKITSAPTPETVQQESPNPYKTKVGWDWDAIAAVIKMADAVGERRVKRLTEWVDVSEPIAKWMIRRCSELSFIDIERAPIDHQAARDAAAAAL